jgi:hypothetical protein
VTRIQAIAELALTIETGGDVEEGVQAACLAGVDHYETSGPSRRVGVAGGARS